MSNTKEYRIAETFTEFLQANTVIIYDENNPQKIRQQGKGKELKKAAIKQLLETKHTYQQAEQRVEQRLIRKQLILINIQA